QIDERRVAEREAVGVVEVAAGEMTGGEGRVDAGAELGVGGEPQRVLGDVLELAAGVLALAREDLAPLPAGGEACTRIAPEPAAPEVAAELDAAVQARADVHVAE